MVSPTILCGDSLPSPAQNKKRRSIYVQNQKSGKALASNIYSMVVEAPRVAEHCLPGQFIIAKIG